jgi:hypothetical protein
MVNNPASHNMEFFTVAHLNRLKIEIFFFFFLNSMFSQFEDYLQYTFFITGLVSVILMDYMLIFMSIAGILLHILIKLFNKYKITLDYNIKSNIDIAFSGILILMTIVSHYLMRKSVVLVNNDLTWSTYYQAYEDSDKFQALIYEVSWIISTTINFAYYMCLIWFSIN